MPLIEFSPFNPGLNNMLVPPKMRNLLRGFMCSMVGSGLDAVTALR